MMRTLNLMMWGCCCSRMVRCRCQTKTKATSYKQAMVDQLALYVLADLVTAFQKLDGNKPIVLGVVGKLNKSKCPAVERLELHGWDCDKPPTYNTQDTTTIMSINFGEQPCSTGGGPAEARRETSRASQQNRRGWLLATSYTIH